MIKDRGSIKWTAMMLPEHVKQLRDWEREEAWLENTELDEQQLEEMNQQIFFAMEEARKVAVLCRKPLGEKAILGLIHYYDPHRRLLRIMNDEGKKQDVSLDAIIGIEMDV
ncbi:YolD-like family protein [Fictibacillus sp. WQ 8-8]|uniref:YolD-like family protein n=1 Tax=unclassified Fictibacillus TaxID=2644029 RepID=UPI0006A7D521|nr:MULTISPECIES: YolD-like family protein [unclassified Fictibacillus]MCQ6266122.1 YolD-like family protein [Fictibacillus sp. WQ 8-8]UZJ80740.1 YolD-like family protein [Fictibacillus sp. KU28468]SFD71214.1 YolD-like protein [Bacillus sp. OV194]